MRLVLAVFLCMCVSIYVGCHTRVEPDGAAFSKHLGTVVAGKSLEFSFPVDLKKHFAESGILKVGDFEAGCRCTVVDTSFDAVNGMLVVAGRWKTSSSGRLLLSNSRILEHVELVSMIETDGGEELFSILISANVAKPLSIVPGNKEIVDGNYRQNIKVIREGLPIDDFGECTFKCSGGLQATVMEKEQDSVQLLITNKNAMFGGENYLQIETVESRYQYPIVVPCPDFVVWPREVRGSTIPNGMRFEVYYSTSDVATKVTVDTVNDKNSQLIASSSVKADHITIDVYRDTASSVDSARVELCIQAGGERRFVDLLL